MFEAVEALAAEHADLERQLALPATHADQRLAKRLNQRYAELSAIVTTWLDWRRLGDDIEAARELAAEDGLRRGGRPTRRTPPRGRGAAAPPARAA